MFRASEIVQCVKVLVTNPGNLSFITRIKLYLLNYHTSAKYQKLDCYNDCIAWTLQMGYKRPYMPGHGDTYPGISGVQGHAWLSSEIVVVIYCL